jgi:hypothetical protein
MLSDISPMLVVFSFAGAMQGKPSQAAVRIAYEVPNKYIQWNDFWILVVPLIGAFCFGGVLGWVTAEAVARTKDFRVQHLAGIVSATLGAAITSIFRDPLMFAWYCIGLGIGYGVHVLLHQFDQEGNLIKRPRR